MFDAKTRVVDQEAKNFALEGLIKKYHYIKTSGFYMTSTDFSKSLAGSFMRMSEIDNEKQLNDSATIFSFTKGAGCEPSLGDICVIDEEK